MAAVSVAVLLSAGLTACTNALTSGLPLEVSKFELGEIAGAEVPVDATSAIPAANYTGGAERVLLEQENDIAVFNIVLDDTIGDLYIGNLALKVFDPVTNLEVLLAVIMFPETVYKTASEAFGGATGAVGNNYLVKLAIKLSTSQAVATVELSNTEFATLPSVSDITQLADPSATTYPHQVLLSTPETGAPSLIVKRPGDGMWWGFSLSWPADAYNFGVISGGYQGDWYGTENIEVVFGGYFYMTDTDFAETIVGGTNWVGGSNISLLNGGTWS